MKRKLTYEQLKLRTIVRSLKKRELYLKKKCSSFENRFTSLKTLMNTKEYEILNSLNKQSSNFVHAQLKNVGKKRKGWRFTNDQKILCLTILKTSPKCYRLLRKIFTLPSKQTLMKTINKFPFNVGLNSNVMKCLQNTVAKMDNKDKYCVLLFDEMQLSANISYSIKEDTFFGFEDCGDEFRHAIADHVLVFMLRGIRKKWKQPFSFYFVYRTMKSVTLSNKIVEMIRAARNIGLKVLSTICDQGSSNRGAIRLLKEQTNRYCLQQGLENRFLGFTVDDEEVVPLFDPPHLLKCFRNALLDNDISFKWQQNVQTASWRHIVEFYGNDQGCDDIRIAPKLTDKHVFKEKINKMKVSLAAQIFSQRLSAVMRKFAGLSKFTSHLLTRHHHESTLNDLDETFSSTKFTINMCIKIMLLLKNFSKPDY